MVVVQKFTETLQPDDLYFLVFNNRLWLNQLVVETLMIALGVIIHQVLFAAYYKPPVMQGQMDEDVSEVLICYPLGMYESPSHPQPHRVTP
jgi:hypothetical protein